MATRIFGVITSTDAVAGYGTWDRWVSFENDLDAGETLTGTPEVTTTVSGITIGAPTVNTQILIDDDITTPIGMAVQFRITATAAQTIKAPLLVSCATSDSNRKTVTVWQPIAPTDSG